MAGVYFGPSYKNQSVIKEAHIFPKLNSWYFGEERSYLGSLAFCGILPGLLKFEAFIATVAKCDKLIMAKEGCFWNKLAKVHNHAHNHATTDMAQWSWFSEK